MKKYLFLILFVIFLTSFQSIASTNNNLKTVPLKPNPGDEVTIIYNSANTPLSKADKVNMTVYFASYKSNNWGNIDTAFTIEMTKKNDEWEKKIKTFPSTDFIALYFSANNIDDTNNKKGYCVNFYNKDGNVIPGSELDYAACMLNWGKMFLGYDSFPEKAFDKMKKVFTAHPKLKKYFLREYLRAMYGTLPKDEYDKQLKKELDQFGTRKDLPDDAYSTIVSYYKSLKMEDKAKEVAAFAVKKYPSGSTAINQKYYEIYAEKNPEQKLKLAKEMADQFRGNSKNTIGYNVVIPSLFQNNRTDLLKKLAAGNNAFMKDLTLNNLLLTYFLKYNKDLNVALEFAAKGYELTNKEMKKPLSDRSSFQTKKMAEEKRQNLVGTFLFNYGDLLNRKNKKEKSLKILTQAIELFPINEIKSKYIELYAESLWENKEFNKDLSFIESVVKNGKSNDNINKMLKELYVKTNGNEKGYKSYFDKLNTIGHEKEIQLLKEEMISEAAPNFNLKNLEGKSVSLKEFRGKIVILDFWATWCGYCKRSFSGMQKLVDEYSNDKDVEFLFIDTQESIPNPKNAVEEYLKKNKYSFNVLFDSDGKVMPEYKVTGLPTKIVIDKKGNIRFRLLGFDGDQQAMINEINNIITLLR